MQKLEDWCLAHGIIPETRRHEFKSLRGKALAWAQEDLDARDRIRPNGLTDQELERQRANLEAWKELDAAWARQRSRDDTTGS